MAPTPVQSTSRRIIPAEEWSKMSRAEKRDFLREQRAIARSRKSKEESAGGSEITIGSSTTVDTDTMVGQRPTATLVFMHDHQSDDQGSVSSAPVHGVE